MSDEAGLKKEGTIVSVDLRGFGLFSTVAKSHEARQVPREILEGGNKAVLRNGGVYLKGMGDGRFYSYNVEFPLRSSREGAVAAVRSGLQMQDEIARARDKMDPDISRRLRQAFDESHAEGDIEELLMGRVGISTGELDFSQTKIQTLDSEGRVIEITEKDINGEPMKTAKRLEPKARPGQILVDQRTRDLAGDRFDWEGPLTLEVKEGTLTAYRPIREKPVTFDIGKVKEAFFGREQEILSIRDYLTNGGQPFVLRGEMGIGKTTTAEQALGSRGYFTVKFSLLDRTDPFSGLKHLYRQVFKDAEKIKKSPLLKDVYPYIGLFLGQNVEVDSDPDVRKTKIIEAYHRVRKIVDIVLWDDVQWSDPLTLDVLRSAIPEERNLITARPEFSPDFPCTQVELRGLGKKESGEILKKFLGKYYGQIDQETTEQILERTEGNPFHTKYLAISLREKMELGENYRTVLSEIPAELSSLVVGMIQGFGPSIFRAFQIGSHLRRKWIYRKDIEELTGQSLDEEVLRNMAKSGLISLNRPNTIEVRDEKVLEVIYDTTPDDKKKEIHGAWGRYFEGLVNRLESGKTRRLEKPRSQGADLSVSSSKEPSPESTYTTNVKNQGADKSASKAVEGTDRANVKNQEPTKPSIQPTTDASGKQRRRTLVLNTADQYALSNVPEKSVAYLVELGKIEREEGATETSLEHLNTALGILNRGEQTRGTADIVRETIQETDETLKKAGLYEDRGILQEPNLTKIEEEESRLRAYKYRCLASLGTANVQRKNYQQALEFYNQARQLAEEHRDINYVIDIEHSIGSVHRRMENFEEAKKWLERSLEKAEDRGYDWGVYNAHNELGQIYRKENNLERVEVEYQAAWTAAQRMGNKVAMATVKRNLAILEEGRKNLEKALDYSQDSLQLSREVGRPETEIGVLSTIVHIYIGNERAIEAVYFLEEAHRILQNPINRELKSSSAGRYLLEKIEETKIKV